MSDESFVVIQRDQQDDGPDAILNVWVFSTNTEALEYTKGILERDQACWKARLDWNTQSMSFCYQWFDEIVRPHLYLSTEDEARKRLREMVIKEFGPEPTLDGVCGELDVFRSIPGGSGERIWSNSEKLT